MKPLLFTTLLLTACGADYSKMPAVSQPRALLWGASTPECIAFCEVGVSVVQGEKNTGQNTQTGGDVSQVQTYAPQTSKATTFSPSLSGVK